jgi:putative hydrolase
VSDTPFFGGGDFLRNMLGDLVRMMPTGPGVQWQLAYQLAAQIASGGGPDANPDPIERIRLEELSAIAELHVAEVTGMPVSPSGTSVRLVPTSRVEWARRILDIWHPVLDRLVAVLAPDFEGEATEPGEGGSASGAGSPDPSAQLEGLGGPDDEAEAEMEALLGQWATAMFPAMTAWQVGSVAGHLAERALGQYDVPLSAATGNELLVVTANLASVAADWSLPIDDLRLWLCVHEMAYHTALSRPAVSDRIASLVIEHAQRVRPDADALGQLLQQADPSDMASFAQILGDPSALQQGEATAALEQVRAELDAVTAAVSGYAEYVTTLIANRLIGNTVPIGEAMRRRRVSRGDGEKVAETLFGLRLDQAQIDRGARFVAGVLDRSGELQLAKMWTDATHLPTPAEVDAPGLWLARLELPSEG